MALHETVSITITEENTRVTLVQLSFPFGADLHVALRYETRHKLDDGTTYSITDAGEISRGPEALSDTITMGGQTITFNQWLKAGEQLFDKWFVADTTPPPEP